MYGPHLIISQRFIQYQKTDLHPVFSKWWTIISNDIKTGLHEIFVHILVLHFLWYHKGISHPFMLQKCKGSYWNFWQKYVQKLGTSIPEFWLWNKKWQEPSFMNITETQFQLQRKRQVIWQYSTCLCAKKVHLEKGKCYHYLKLFAKGLSFHLLLWTYSKGEHYLVYANSKQCEFRVTFA